MLCDHQRKLYIAKNCLIFNSVAGEHELCKKVISVGHSAVCVGYGDKTRTR